MWFRKKRVPDWHETFVAITRRVFDASELTFDQALATLRNANGLQLLAFDELGRRGRYHWHPAGEYAKTVVRTALSNPEHADAYLFYEAGHGSGFVREQALRALRGRDQRLACAAILIRIEDWVPEVASTAALLLKDIAVTSAARYCFELLDLIVALRPRQRFAPHWSGILEPALLQPKWRDARLEQLRSRVDDVRHLAHQLIWRANEHFALDTPRMAIGDSSRLVALWGLSRISDFADAALRQSMLHEGLRSRLASVRSDALRRYCRAGYNNLHEVLEAAIFDPGHAVRGVAAYQLNEIFKESALVRWRAAFDRGNQGEAMVMALSEFGDAHDEARLRAHLTSHRGRVRALALRGLLRIGATDSSELLAVALRDSSSRVVDVALGGYTRGTDALTVTTLNEAIAGATTPGMRARLIGASRLLSKWDRLQFLAAHFAVSHETDREALKVAMTRWIVTANRSFIQASPERKLDLRRAIETARSIHPARFWDQVLHLI
jgi:HEAT repeat protein